MATAEAKAGWLDRVAHFTDSIVGAVSPARAVTRLRARQQITHFRRRAALPSLDRQHAVHTLWSPDSSREQMDRVQIIREARDCEENIPFVAGLFRLLYTYLFETLTYAPNTGDPGMDSEIRSYLNDFWMPQADAFLVHAFPALFGLTCCGSLRDGDGGLAFVDAGDILRLAAVEADQIGEPNVMTSARQDYVAGVWKNPDGTKRAYRVYDRRSDFTYGNFQDIPAASFIYLADAQRPTATRNVSVLAPIIPNLRDKYEAMAMVKVTLKRQLEDAFAAFTATGAAPLDFGKPPSVEGRGEEQLRSITKAGITTYYGQGDKLVSLENRHVNDNFLNFVKVIDTENCNGLHLPYGFVVDNADPGGAGVRMVLHRTSREFGRLKGKMVVPALNRIRDMVLLYAMAKGDISKHLGYNKGRWMFPPPPTADMQRESDVTIKEVEAGLNTRTSALGEYGEEFAAMLEQNAQEEYLRQMAAKKWSKDGVVVLPTQIYTTAADALVAKAIAPPQDGLPTEPVATQAASRQDTSFSGRYDGPGHWVTIEGEHVYIKDKTTYVPVEKKGPDHVEMTIENSVGYSGKSGKKSYIAELGAGDERDFSHPDGREKPDKNKAYRKGKGSWNETHQLKEGVYEKQQYGERTYHHVHRDAEGYIKAKEISKDEAHHLTSSYGDSHVDGT